MQPHQVCKVGKWGKIEMVWGKKTPLYFHVPLHDGTNSGAIFPQIPYVFLFSNCMDFSDWTLYTEITHVVPFPLVVFDLM